MVCARYLEVVYQKTQLYVFGLCLWKLCPDAALQAKSYVMEELRSLNEREEEKEKQVRAKAQELKAAGEKLESDTWRFTVSAIVLKPKHFDTPFSET